MVKYKGANIHVRQIGPAKFYADWAWAHKASERMTGVTCGVKVQAISKTKATIDAVIASQDINNMFFNRKLIGGE